jgi:hypothetical protein
MSVWKNVRRSVRDRNGETRPAHNGDIDEVVAHEAGFKLLETRVRQEMLVGFELDLGSLVYAGDPKTEGPVLDRPACAARNQSNFDSCALEELYSMSVLNIELFDFRAFVRIDDPPVRQDAIDVKNHHPDGKNPIPELIR